MQDLRRLAQQPDLRVVGMDVEELGHANIVSARARPRHDNAYSGSTSTAAAGAESPYTTHFWTGFVGSVVLWPVLAVAASTQGLDASLALAQRLPVSAWALMVFCGLLGTTGHLFLILALGKARTATLMPFVYVQIGFAALIAWLAFDHVPDHWAWVGMAVIAACGATSAALNMRRPGAATPAAAVDVLPE